MRKEYDAPTNMIKVSTIFETAITTKCKIKLILLIATQIDSLYQLYILQLYYLTILQFSLELYLKKFQITKADNATKL